MGAGDERVRFCGHCNAVVGWYATFCSDCGLSLAGARGTAKPNSDPGKREKEYFRAQMRICHRAREEALHLHDEIRRQGERVANLEGQRVTTQLRQEVLVCSERLLDLEQEWEDVQRRFNASTENLEEALSSEVADLASHVNLPEELQEAIREEGHALETTLTEAEEDLRRVRRERDLLQARCKNSWSGFATGSTATLWLGIGALICAALGACWGVLVADLEPQPLVLSLLPAWLGLIALFLNARAKSL